MISKAPAEAVPHVLALLARCPEEERGRFAPDSPRGRAHRAALDYLGTRIVRDDGESVRFAADHGADLVDVTHLAGELRSILGYRAYVGEWIARGRPVLDVPRPAITKPIPVTRQIEPVAPEDAPPGFIGGIVKRVKGWFNAPGTIVPAPRNSLGRRPVNKWTGTPGTQSYYDKDSSPE